MGARAILQVIDSAIVEPTSAEGLYQIFAAGFLPVPYLWEGREEFPKAVAWRTQLINGGVQVVDEQNRPIPPAHRAQAVIAMLDRARRPGRE